MSYTVLARRYRSQTFDDVLGQDAVAKTLKNAIQTGRVAHAYLFCGTRGCGKTTMARILAKSLNCLSAPAPTITPCLKCDSCLAVNSGEDIDVLEIDGASNTGVDHIRQLRDNAAYRPARSRFKIYIIDEVHMLSAGAFNALLKILEEPPPHVKFIFATTEPHKVLATIQSRCQRFDFHHISPDIIGKQASAILKQEGIDFEPDLLAALGRLANGSMRDALSLLDQLISASPPPLTAAALYALVGMPDRQKIAELLKRIAQRDGAGALVSLDGLLASGQSASEICDAMIELMRETMVYLACGKTRQMLALTEQEWQDVQALAELFDTAGLIFNITAIERLRWLIRNSPASRALLEALILRLALSEQFIGLEHLLNAAASGEALPTELKKKDLTSDQLLNAQPARASDSAMLSTPADAEKIPLMDSAEDLLATVCQLAERAGGNGASLLKKASSARWDNNTLRIIFPADNQGKFACQMSQSKSAALQKVFAEGFGRPLSVAFETEIPKKQNLGGAELFAEATLAAAPTNADGRNEALNDPMVRLALAELNATPIDVQKIQFKPAERFDEQAVDTLDDELR